MQTQAHIDMMRDFYRLYERHEIPQSAEAYWTSLAHSAALLSAKYKDPVLDRLLPALMDGLGEIAKGGAA